MIQRSKKTDINSCLIQAYSLMLYLRNEKNADR